MVWKIPSQDSPRWSLDLKGKRMEAKEFDEVPEEAGETGDDDLADAATVRIVQRS
jgi:hypothetical protein